MADAVKITITAKDDASDNFQKIGANAAKMGQAVTQAGKAAGSGLTAVGPGAQKAQKALADVETQAKKTAASGDDIKKKWTEVGAAAGVLVGGLAIVGRAYVEQNGQIDGLERAYGDASVQLLEFAEEMQQTTVYSNDAARAATLSAASLAQNYGLTADQIEEVVKASADLATVTGIDLADATSRVAGAIRGEGEAAELLGLNMSDAAVQSLAAAAGIEGWNTTMTEAEKAAFRFTVAMDQAAYAQGAAADAADTNAGKAKQFVNVLQDQVQALGGAIGPAAEYASVLGSFALAAPVAGAAIGRLMAGIKAAQAGMVALRASSALASLALGPVGIAAAGVAAVVTLGELTDWFGLTGDSAAAAVDPINDLSDAVLAFAQAGADALVISKLTEAAKDLDTALNEISAEGVEAEMASAMDELNRLGAEFDINSTERVRAIRDGIATGVAEFDAAIANYRRLQGVLEVIKADGEETADALFRGIIDRLDEPMVNATQALTDLSVLTSRLADDHDLASFNTDVQAMSDNFAELYGILPIGSEAIEAQRRAWEQYQRTIDGVRDAQRGEGFLDLDDSAVGGQEAYAAATERSATNMAHMREIAVSTNATMAELKEEANATAAAMEDKLTTAMASATAAMVAYAAEQAAALREAQSAVVDYIASGEQFLELLYESGKALSGDQGFIGGVIDLQNSLTALDSTYSILIEGSERLGKSTQTLADHYSELAGVALDEYGTIVYEWAKIDDLRAHGIITEEQYADAVDATTRILRDNEAVQQDIAAIQVMQAPYLAALSHDTEDYVETLARQDAQQQRNVLTLMDANSQQQLSAIYAAATDAAMGNLGANGETYVQAMVDGLQITNPLLYEMMQTAGDIDANGVFQFDGGDATALVDTLSDLNTTLGDLVDIIGEVNGLTLDPKVSPDAETRMQRILDKYNEIRSINQEIGTYTPATPATGDATGGPMGAESGYAREPGQPERTETITITANAEPYFRVVSDVEAKADAIAGTEHQLIMTADNTQAIGVFRDTEGSIVAITDGAHIVKVTGDPTDATNDIALVNQVLNDLNGTVGVIYVEGDNSNATASMSDADAQRSGLDGSTATISIYANDYASAILNSLTGFQGSAYVNVFANRIGNFGPTGTGLRDGGIVDYDAAAVDGIVTKSGQRQILVGEAGREIVSLPPGSGVTPAAMTNTLLGSGRGNKDVHLHFHNAVYGFDDFQQQIAQGVRSAMYQGQYQ